jgi:ankyrin repeat protein
MKLITIPILFSFFLLSCHNREDIVDKSKLISNDYRLFQNTPAWELAKAVWDGNEKKINIILNSNKDLLNYQESEFGQSLLFLTIKNQQLKSFNILVKCGADIKIHDTYNGSSPLTTACKYKGLKIEFAKILIDHGANVNDVEVGPRRKGNSTRFTPLSAACRIGNMELVKLLIKNGADVNYKNEFNFTVLSEATIQDYYDIVLTLLQNGADYSEPIFYRENENKQMYLVDVLREFRPDLNSQEYKDKLKIISFLRTKGIEYRSVPIPEFIIKKIKEDHPNDWQEYMEKY